MGRFFRVVLLVATIAAAYGGMRMVRRWQEERRRKEVFRASDSAMLLQPARRLVMPVGKTLERFRVAPGKTVLEVGPGPGYYTPEAARLVRSDGRVVCLDVQPEMIRVLEGRLTEYKVTNVDLIVGDATHLPLRDGCVDVAYCVTVLGEVPRPEDALAEARRVIRDGGTLGFAESLGDPDYVRAGTLRDLCNVSGFTEEGHWRGVTGYTSRFAAI